MLALAFLARVMVSVDCGSRNRADEARGEGLEGLECLGGLGGLECLGGLGSLGSCLTF